MLSSGKEFFKGQFLGFCHSLHIWHINENGEMPSVQFSAGDLYTVIVI